MTDSLDVYLYEVLAAKIRRHHGTLSLRYVDEYIADPNSVPISLQFPLTPQAIHGDRVRWFLENLLPDREDVRSSWAVKAGLSSTDGFDLLAVYGSDVAGALEFYPEGVPKSGNGTLVPRSTDEIAQTIREIRADDSRWLRDGIHKTSFSLAGAQGKFALARRGEYWFEPTGAMPSTHIFKPGIKDFEGSDVTEHITMTVARQLGLSAAKTEIISFAGEHTLVVERFDRFELDGEIKRIHQEDLAQATATPVLKKYENHGGPSYRDLFALFDKHLAISSAQQAKAQFVHGLVFAWVIGHGDGHAKNYSIQHVPGSIGLAPHYDLNSSLVFEPEQTCRAMDFSAFDAVELSFSVNGSFRIGDFDLDSLTTLEHDAGLIPGSLTPWALTIEANITELVRDAIAGLPKELQSLTAVTNFPFMVFSQRKRIRALFGLGD
ncbi:HipA domain-containing protein [Timonella senegalensis]|uniref:HipA domain-containing protein n=1 Tax=Timonella senegalensis TaxID=1465825 RepID=UPI002FDE57DF